MTERIFITDKDFEKMREPYSQEFFIEWARAYDYYIKGQWSQARAVLQGTLVISVLLSESMPILSTDRQTLSCRY